MSFINITRKQLVAGAAVPVAVIASGAMVWQASYAAFSDVTSNPTNNWSSGTVKLADDDSNTAMFNVTNMKPGATGVKCINVTSTGSLASTVKLYGTSYATTAGLADNISLKVEQGTGSTSPACASFTGASTLSESTLGSFGTTKTAFANGVGTWAPVGGVSDTKSFRITYTLNANTPDSAQGGTAAVGFTWEAQNS
jgi:hypothetical protein